MQAENNTNWNVQIIISQLLCSIMGGMPINHFDIYIVRVLAFIFFLLQRFQYHLLLYKLNDRMPQNPTLPTTNAPLQY